MRRTVPGFFLSQAQPHLSTDLGFEEKFIEERIGCSVLLACVLISCSSSFDFYSQAYWQVKSLVLVAQIATLTPPRILESLKAAEYYLYCFRFLRIFSACDISAEIPVCIIRIYCGTIDNVLFILPWFLARKRPFVFYVWHGLLMLANPRTNWERRYFSLQRFVQKWDIWRYYGEKHRF